MVAPSLALTSSREISLPFVDTQKKAESSSSSSLYTLYERTIKNSNFWALSLGALAVTAITFTAIAFPPLTAAIVAVSLIGALAIGAYCNRDELKKRFICELGLFGTMMKTDFPFSNFNSGWYTEITPQITLGANPLKSRGHGEAIAEKHQAVLSMIEPHETLPYLSGVPVTPEDWKNQGKVDFLNLPNPDWTPLPDEDVDRGVEFMHQQISQGKRVYVHCNGGVGRSATIVLCYLIKHQKMKPEEAVKFVASKRWIVVNENSIAFKAFLQRLNKATAA